MAGARSTATARWGSRRALVVAIATAGALSWWWLGLSSDLIPDRDQLRGLARFFGHAFSPALAYEGESVPADAMPLLLKAIDGARRTVVFAAAAMSLALPCALVLAFLASSAWWARERAADRAGGSGAVARVLGPVVFATTRLAIALLRSVHELLWAVIFLAAIGLSDFSAVIAIAIPYTGTLAKVFSEMIDEVPRDGASALRAAGASPAQVYAFGLLPRAVPDMTAYGLYRFECALRSSAVVGFFGPETLGKFIRQSWNENHYGEVWTYLYTLFALIVVVDLWSGSLRKRFVA